MRILGGTRAATSGAGYLWVKSLQANWELGDFSPVLLENLVGNNLPVAHPNELPPGL